MDGASFSLAGLFYDLALPLGRLLLTMSLGLLAASLIEAMNWTNFMARLAAPLVRAGRLSSEAGASFALAFFSPSTANALLAEAYAQGKMKRLEMVLSNLFNSSPAYLVHLPTVFSLAWAFLGKYAFVYVGLTFCAAGLRTLGTLVVARLWLPTRKDKAGDLAESHAAGIMPQAAENAFHACGKTVAAAGEETRACAGGRQAFAASQALLDGDAATPAPGGGPGLRRDWKGAFRKGFSRWRKRLFKLLVFTIPIYCLIYAAQKAGWFAQAEGFLTRHIAFLTVLPAEAVGIVVLNLAAESGAAFSAAASLMQGQALEPPVVILALLIGNILSSPMRLVRHQFPSYAGYFGPGLAMRLVLISQSCRIVSLALMAWLYWLVVS